MIGQLGVHFLIQAANKPLLSPAYNLARDIATLDPQDASYLESVALLAETAMAAANQTPPVNPFLAPFRLLSLDPASGAITGDFDAFVYAFTSAEEAVSTGAPPIGVGATATTTYGPWLAWYQNHGKFLYSVASAMGLGPEYVQRVTGWRWMFGSIGIVQGTAGNDILEEVSSASSHNVSMRANGAISISTGSQATRDQALFGYGGNDELRGNDGVDRLVGGAGNDLLKGGSGSDMYVYASGDGLDRITDDSGTEDVIYFSSELRSENLEVSRVSGTNDLFLHFGDSTQGIVLTSQWNASGKAIEQFHFVGQDGLDAGDIATRYLASLTTHGNDTIVGSWANERISGPSHGKIRGGTRLCQTVPTTLLRIERRIPMMGASPHYGDATCANPAISIRN